MEALNQLQKEVDKEEFKLEDRRRQLYADWYKFMLAEYDYSLDDITYEGEVNNIREYLAVEAVELQAAIEAQQGRRDDIRSTAEALHVKVETWNHQNPNAPYRFRLQPVQGARYWEPTEPVLLFAGEDATPSEAYLPREGRDHVLFFENLFPENMNGSDDIPGFLSGFLMKNGFINITSNDGSKDPWGPLFMDWQVELFPFTKPQGANAEQKNWPSNTIVEHFDLPQGSVDLHLENKEVTDSDHYKRWIEKHPTIALQSGRSLQTFEGRSILTPDAHRPLVTQLKRLLDEATAEGKNNMEALINTVEKWSLLAQSLSGFNDALLMRKQILQLPIDDPLARTTILKEFTGRIKDVVGDQNTVAPLPSNLFLPLREGAFRIRKVRLVDCWGRVKELKKDVLDSETNPVIVAEPMKQPKILGEGKNSMKPPRDMAYLPPRIVQPCRLNFRWLSAGNSDTQPASLNVEAGKWGSDSPICGYVLPNFLDQSLHVHDAEGRGLGVLARSGAALVWNPFPGRKSEHNPPASYHPYLKQLVESFRHHGVRFLNAFLETAQKSMAGTQPENYAQFDGMPLLVGRPLALVRAQCSMELRGQAAVNNSWPSRQQVYSGEEGASSPTLDFDQLRFALQVGDPHKVDDGLLAFYLDTPLEASSDDPDTAIISELFAPIVEVDGDGGAETFWAELGKLEKILGIYKNRREGHMAALQKLENEDKASLETQLEFFNTNSPEDHSEQIAAIREELDRIDQKITVLQTKCNELALDISDMQGAIFRAKAVQGQQAGGANIYKPESDLLALTFDDDPVTLGILMDPRAGLYLKTGILPEKRIDIPSEQFADALNRIQIAFLTTPVISPIPRKAEVEGASSQLFFLTSPKQTGYQWGWMQQESRNTWEEIPPDQITQPPYGFLDQFEPQAIYEGWMTLLKDQENEQPNGNE
jgi:hypothetical protein